MSDTTEIAIDRVKPDGRAKPAPSDRPDAQLMHEELQSVIASPDFARAPIMKRLLAFLVGETAAGRGEQLKAYSVAVDGLGRAPDYDARADSYPRVQVGRLRRMLESYYATTPPLAGYRLTIPSGRYRVALQTAGEQTDPPETDVLADRPWMFGSQVILLLALLAAATMTILRIVPVHNAQPHAGQERPLLDLAGVKMAERSELGRLVRAALINGLSRSSMFDLRPVRLSGTLDAQPLSARYRLSADLIDSERPRLFLRLTGVSPERLLWSGDVDLPDGKSLDGGTLDQTLAPVIATIGRANGVIATHQLQENGNLEPMGYSCWLLYHHYRRYRTDPLSNHVRHCVERSLNFNPNDAELQAAAAQLSIERMVYSGTDPRDRPTLLLTAQRHAQIAASVDQFDAWGNLARARIAMMRGTCAQTVNFGMRASQLQRYDPTLLADAGILLLNCGDPRAEGLIRRAIALDDNPEGQFYGHLLLLAISRDDPALAREALVRQTPPVIGRDAHFHLTSAAGYAMNGDVARARSAWRQLQTASPAIARDPQGFLERLGYDARLRAKAMGHLRQAGLIAG